MTNKKFYTLPDDDILNLIFEKFDEDIKAFCGTIKVKNKIEARIFFRNEIFEVIRENGSKLKFHNQEDLFKYAEEINGKIRSAHDNS